MSDAFTVDVSQLVALGNRCAGARPIVAQELDTAGRQSGFILVAQAVVNAPVGRINGGNLRAGIGPPEVEVLSNGVTVVIPSHASYSLAVEKGRRAFGPVSKRFLHFFVGGDEVFTKWVKAVAARPFLRPALQQTAAKTTAVFAVALDRATRRILGGSV